MPQGTLSPTRRRPALACRDLSLFTIRPSLLDLRFNGDVWVAHSGQGPLVVWLGAVPLVQVAGLPLDIPSLNDQLARVRGRRSRCRHSRR